MSHFEGNLKQVNKIYGSGHELAEDESVYKEDLGAMASPAYAPPASIISQPSASDNSLISYLSIHLTPKLVANIIYQFFTFDFYYNLEFFNFVTFAFVHLIRFVDL